MLKIKNTNPDVGDCLVVKNYGTYVTHLGLIIQQTDKSYAFMFLPSCVSYPYEKSAKASMNF